MKNKIKFAVLGGDMRSGKLAELLSSDGHDVTAFAIEREPLYGVRTAPSIEAAAAEADCVVLPLPVTGKPGFLNTPFSPEEYSIDAVFGALNHRQTICAGRVTPDAAEAADTYGLKVHDYFAREELAVLNAVSTAEGAVQIAMEETPFTIHRSSCLVIGFGRIGKLLAHRLRGLGASVTVSARSFSDIAWINAYGYESVNTAALASAVNRFDVIFNTVPARILTEAILKELHHGCLCIDLASKPGGMDFAAASKLGVKAIWALSLPGEVAPVTSGAIIRDTVYNIIEEVIADGGK